jgi:predicted component of type VI protein secretion system
MLIWQFTALCAFIPFHENVNNRKMALESWKQLSNPRDLLIATFGTKEKRNKQAMSKAVLQSITSQKWKLFVVRVLLQLFWLKNSQQCN